jgi:hypothetical protein
MPERLKDRDALEIPVGKGESAKTLPLAYEV